MDTFALRDPGDIGVAVLGAGRMGQTHVRTLATIPNAHVVVVADPNVEAAEKGMGLARARRASADPLEAIADPDVDAVVIVTPTSTHATLIEAAIRAGKAVWSEKPIALDLEETGRIVDLWRTTGVPVQLGFMRRFDPGYLRMKELIDTGAVGRIEQFHAASRDTFLPPAEFIAHSGGSFLDMAVHDLDLARFLVGEVDEVYAWATTLFAERFSDNGDWDTSALMLRFRNGALGTIETARHSPWGYDIRTEVAGSISKVVVDAGRKTPAVHMREFGYEGDLYENFPDRFADAFRRELEAFFGALAAGRVPSPGPEDALETLRLALACLRSWKEGRAVRVEEVR